MPWIILEAWYASQKTSFRTDQQLDGSLEASLTEKIQGISAGVRAAFRREAHGTAIMVTSERFPVAWRPALISVEHYEKVKGLRERGYFKQFLAYVHAIDSGQEILNQLRKDFPKDLVSADKVAKEMGEGKAMPFQPEDKDHLDYLEDTDYLLASGLEYYW